MQAVEQTLITFFTQAAKKDSALLIKLAKESSFNVDSKHWSFTLPNLYTFLQQLDKVYNGIDYKQFRQLIFKSSINQTVKLYGAEIVIDNNQFNVDKSGYSLIWLAQI
jgi:hypothetical protein